MISIAAAIDATLDALDAFELGALHLATIDEIVYLLHALDLALSNRSYLDNVDAEAALQLQQILRAQLVEAGV